MQPYPPYGAPPPAMSPAYGMPPPAYGPPPGYYPPPPAFNTREGVKYFSRVLLLEVLIGLIGFLIALGAIATLITLGSGNWGAALAGAVGIVMAAFVIVILGIVLFVFAIIALIKFYQGKDEFGPQHAKNFMMAIIFLILGIVLPNIGGAFSPSYGYGANITDTYNSLKMSVAVSGALQIVGGLMMALMFTFMVKAVTNEEASKFKIGTIMVMVGPIIGIAAVLAILPSKPGTVTLSDLATMGAIATSALSLGGILSLIGYYFFYQGYKSILAKMDSGVIRPGMMPVQMAPPGYAPPPAPYQPPPPAPYPQQPMPPQYPPQYPAQYPPPQYPPQQQAQYPPPQYPPQQPPQYPPPQY